MTEELVKEEKIIVVDEEDVDTETKIVPRRNDNNFAGRTILGRRDAIRRLKRLHNKLSNKAVEHVPLAQMALAVAARRMN